MTGAMMKNGYAASETVLAGHRLGQYPYDRASDREYASRRAKIQSFMAEQQLDCLLIAGGTGTWDRNWTNTRWAVNHVGCLLTNASYVVHPAQGDPTVLAFPLNALLPARRAREITEDVRAAPEADVAAVERIRELGLAAGRIGIVEADLNSSIPLRHWRTFERELPDATFSFVTREWWRQVRFTRSAEEVGSIEHAARIGDAMSAAIPAHLRAGLPEREAFACLSAEMIRQGGEYPTQILVASGPTAAAFDTCQRERPMNRILEQGDVLLTEVAPRVPDGAECQTGRTYFFGKPADRYRRMVDVMLETYDAVIDSLRPGKTDRDIAKAAEVISAAGYVRRGPLIHGAEGGASGSLPMVAPPVAVAEVEPFEVVPDIVVCVEIHVAEPDHSGVFLSDTWVTTTGAPRCLNSFPREPLVL
ncbi:M24 family metallopeptidase [Amycolatopsis sp. NPDC051061]|uniref:M24 family metallopeptidase n=1 Tax=Amycolatopsis sp. NPDC051061 TaxID=3155042 RepID=UPI00344A1076